MDTVRDALKQQALWDFAEYERKLIEADGGADIKILPRSEAIMCLREVLARELIRPDGKGFFFEGFKGLNNMTDKELSERLSDNPPPFNCFVWDDNEFHLLFGNQCQAVDSTVLMHLT